VLGISRKIGLKGKINKAFLHFLPIFDIFDDFSKFFSTVSALPFEKSSNMAKMYQKMRNCLVQLSLNPFLHSTSKTRNPGFGYLILH